MSVGISIAARVGGFVFDLRPVELESVVIHTQENNCSGLFVRI